MLTAQRRVVLDAVVRVEVGEVERVRLVVAAEHVRGIVGHEVAEGRRKVVRLAHGGVELGELDVPAVVREDACAEAERLSARLRERMEGRCEP